MVGASVAGFLGTAACSSGESRAPADAASEGATDATYDGTADATHDGTADATSEASIDAPSDGVADAWPPFDGAPVVCASRSGSFACNFPAPDGSPSSACDRATQLCATGPNWDGCSAYTADLTYIYQASAYDRCGPCPTCECLLSSVGTTYYRCTEDDGGGVSFSNSNSCYGSPPVRQRRRSALTA
jgi:hypothetical protein